MIQKINWRQVIVSVLIFILTACGSSSDDGPIGGDHGDDSADSASDETAGGSVEVVVAKVTPQILQKQLAVYGTVTVDAGRLTDISVLYDAVIQRVLVRDGQAIKRGEPLLQVAPTPAAHAEYVQAQTAVTVARAALDRSQRLLSENLATQADVETAQKALLDAQAAFAVQQTQNAALHPLLASNDAVVAQVAVKDGQQIAAGTTLLQLEPVHQRTAYVGVEPEALRDIRIGQRVELTSVFQQLPTSPTQTLTSTVTDIHAAINPITRLVDIRAAIAKQQATNWLSGEQLKGHIILDEQTQLAVPRSALLQDDRGTYLFRVSTDKAHKLSVQKLYVDIGIEAPGYIGIVKGVSAGEAVVTSGNYELQDGMTVREVH